MLVPMMSDHLMLAGLVDLDGTFFIQLGIFILFWMVLQVTVVKPLAKHQDNRYAHLEGARKDAEAMDRRAVESWERYQSELDAARNEAVEVRDLLRQAATEASADMLVTVRTEADKTLAAARKVHEQERQRFQSQLGPYVDDLATLIAGSVSGAHHGHGGAA